MNIAEQVKQRGTRGMVGVFVAVVLVVVVASAGVAIWMSTKNNTMLMWAKSANQARVLNLESFQKVVLRDAKILFSTHKSELLGAHDGDSLPIAGWKKGATEMTETGENPQGTFILTYNYSQNGEDHGFAELVCLHCIQPATLNTTPQFADRQTVKFSYIYSDLKGGSQVSNATYLVRPERTSDVGLGTPVDGIGSLPIPVEDVVKNEDVKITEACPLDASAKNTFLAKVKNVSITKTCQAPAVADAPSRSVSATTALPGVAEKAALDAAAASLAVAQKQYNVTYSQYLAARSGCYPLESINIYGAAQPVAPLP